jgi:hypothetical protein
VSTLLAVMGLAVSVGPAVASVGRLLVQHRTERQRLELVERLAARHGIDAVSTLGKLIPPETSSQPRSGRPTRSTWIK